MFQKISLENYKSIKTLPEFELKPVNVLIGANNSGKSNFLDAFAFKHENEPETIENPKQILASHFQQCNKEYSSQDRLNLLPQLRIE